MLWCGMTEAFKSRCATLAGEKCKSSQENCGGIVAVAQEDTFRVFIVEFCCTAFAACVFVSVWPVRDQDENAIFGVVSVGGPWMNPGHCAVAVSSTDHQKELPFSLCV
jgi:hypothetical protein